METLLLLVRVMQNEVTRCPLLSKMPEVSSELGAEQSPLFLSLLGSRVPAVVKAGSSWLQWL